MKEEYFKMLEVFKKYYNNSESTFKDWQTCYNLLNEFKTILCKNITFWQDLTTCINYAELKKNRFL